MKKEQEEDEYLPIEEWNETPKEWLKQEYARLDVKTGEKLILIGNEMFPVGRFEESNKMKDTVETLRKSGYKVGVYHKRRRDERLIFPELPKGGRTEVCITTPNGRTATGKARCSKEDTYVKKIGVQIALDRALKKLELDKEEINDRVVVYINGEKIPVDREKQLKESCELALSVRDQLNKELSKLSKEDLAFANSLFDLVDLFAGTFALQDLFKPLQNEIPEPNQRKFTSFGSGGVLPKDNPYSW